MALDLTYRALLLDEETLKRESLISHTTDANIIVPLVRTIQDIELTELIGADRVKDLKSKIKQPVAPDTLTEADEQLLNEFIRPFMIWSIQKEIAFYGTYRFTNKGVQQQSSQNSNPVTVTIIHEMQDRAASTATWYANRLLDHLKESDISYKGSCCTKRNTYQRQIFMAKKRC